MPVMKDNIAGMPLSYALFSAKGSKYRSKQEKIYKALKKTYFKAYDFKKYIFKERRVPVFFLIID